MAEAPLSELLEYAILQIVNRNLSEARHQDYWGNWAEAVRLNVPDFVNADLLSAFKRLRKQGILRLTKPDSQSYHASEYSGKEADDMAFFFTGFFNASITDEGRSYWDRAEAPKTTVFISHMAGEKAVALKLQALIQNAFGNAFPVFASSDPISLGGGELWYSYILDNLSKAKIVFVLLSQESKGRPWINFEAGFGMGQMSRIIPLLFRGLSFDSVPFPLKGLQGYQLQQLSDILREISRRMRVPMGQVDLDAAWEELKLAQSDSPQ